MLEERGVAKELRKCLFKDKRNVRVFIKTYIDGSVKKDLHNEKWPVYQAFPLIPF